MACIDRWIDNWPDAWTIAFGMVHKPVKLPAMKRKLGKWAIALLIANEIRGLLMVAPIVWKMF